jgi:hypothetical protein
LILLRAAREGPVAIAAGLWALGWSTALCTFPFLDMLDDMFPYPLQLQPLMAAVIAKATTIEPLRLVSVFAFVLMWASILLGMGTVIGLVPAHLAWDWLGPADRRVWPLRARLALWVAAGVIVASHVAAIGYRAHPLMCSTPIVILMVGWHLRRAGMPVRSASVSHFALLALPPLVFSLIVRQVEAPHSPPLAAIVAISSLSTIALLLSVWHIVFVKNQWNMAAGRTMPVLLLAVAPVMVGGFEDVAKDALVHAHLLPDKGGDIVFLFLVGLLLAPLYKAVHSRAARGMLKKLREFFKRLPDAMERLLRSEMDAERVQEVRDLLTAEPLRIGHYILYSRWGDRAGRFKVVHHTFPGFSPPSVDISARLLGELAKEVAFIDVSMSLRELRFAVVAPELWRLQHRLGIQAASSDSADSGRLDAGVRPIDYRCAHILPIVVGDHVCAFLVIGPNQLDQALRNELLAGRLMQVGLAAS